MMALAPLNNVSVEKKLDITHGDLVYLRGDKALRSGVGVVVSLDRRSFDIYDTQCARKRSRFLSYVPSVAASVPGILVYWFKIEKEMWMEHYDLSLA